MATRELHVAIRGLDSVAAGQVVPRVDIVVYRSDGATIRDELSPVISVTSGGLYVPPAAINAAIMTAVKTFLADANGWNVPNAYNAEYIIGGASPLAAIQIAKKTADTAFTTTSLGDVPAGASGSPALAFSVTSGVTYRFIFEAIIRSSSVLACGGLTVSIPAASVFAASARFPGQSGDGTGSEWVGVITASDDVVQPSLTLVANTDLMITVAGTIVPSANGTVTLRAQGATLADLTVRQGSIGILWVLG